MGSARTIPAVVLAHLRIGRHSGHGVLIAQEPFSLPPVILVATAWHTRVYQHTDWLRLMGHAHVRSAADLLYVSERPRLM